MKTQGFVGLGVGWIVKARHFVDLEFLRTPKNLSRSAGTLSSPLFLKNKLDAELGPGRGVAKAGPTSHNSLQTLTATSKFHTSFRKGPGGIELLNIICVCHGDRAGMVHTYCNIEETLPFQTKVQQRTERGKKGL